MTRREPPRSGRVPPGTSATKSVAYRIVGDKAYPVTLSESKRDREIVEEAGGEVAVSIAEFDGWLRSFLHTPRLPWTVGLTATLAAGICFWLGLLDRERVDA